MDGEDDRDHARPMLAGEQRDVNGLVRDATVPEDLLGANAKGTRRSDEEKRLSHRHALIDFVICRESKNFPQIFVFAGTQCKLFDLHLLGFPRGTVALFFETAPPSQKHGTGDHDQDGSYDVQPGEAQ